MHSLRQHHDLHQCAAQKKLQYGLQRVNCFSRKYFLEWCGVDETRIVIGPNASLSVRHAWQFMLLVTAVSLGIATLMIAQGLWLVLPFTGLELSALGAALWVAMRRNTYREVLVFDEHGVRFEFGDIGRGPTARLEFARSATRVWLESGHNRHAPNRLILSAAGQRISLGRCLTDQERERLNWRIKQLLTPDWCGKPAMQPESECHWGA